MYPTETKVFLCTKQCRKMGDYQTSSKYYFYTFCHKPKSTLFCIEAHYVKTLRSSQMDVKINLNNHKMSNFRYPNCPIVFRDTSVENHCHKVSVMRHIIINSVFHRFRQANFAYGGSILNSGVARGGAFALSKPNLLCR